MVVKICKITVKLRHRKKDQTEGITGFTLEITDDDGSYHTELAVDRHNIFTIFSQYFHNNYDKKNNNNKNALRR